MPPYRTIQSNEEPRFTLFVISDQGLRLLWFNLSDLVFAALFSGLRF
ncbi:hypothetical protein BH695_3342 [Microcystis aeruginosa PCC 7806SL]|uniref:Uncharacterized protein n=1 Tax=Microcystis aeruginosa PCC 7806SL TaxID=1903187 RepID=A0AB33C418_MICA7|nr:hypothetical protein BH695_3342 [Microcystis aeruginosa PCC 7806SL]